MTQMPETIACGFDHAGVPLHDVVLDAVRAAGCEPLDVGTEDDYPDTASDVSAAILDGRATRGIIVCGSGAGVSVAACKIAGIRAACAHDCYTAAQCVTHDDCNALCLGARVVGSALTAELVKAYLGASFSGEERHVRRLGKIAALERTGKP
jgi:ribose 5-phosphate isomerase B